MARNKRTELMDQSTRSALSGLEWAIEQSYEPPKQQDEFSVEDFKNKMLEKNPTYTVDKAKHDLKKLSDQKKLTSRLITLGRTKSRVYKVI